jgi:2-keto-4-pentenoate hydratase/2-oxohepta-3-ene-1,7-dioic acid hydratase in catechol pathway
VKLASYRVPGEPGTRLGAVLDEDRVLDLQGAHAARRGSPHDALADAVAFLAAGPAARELAAELVEEAASGGPEGAIASLEDVELLAPVPRPSSIRDFMAFEDHIVNCIRVVGLGPLAGLDGLVERVLGRRFTLAHRANREFHARPLYYKGNPASVVGHGATIRPPSYTRKLDYELEFGVFIGPGGRDIRADSAAAHIGGYVIFDDFSARDVQLTEQAGRLGPAKGKDFDTGNALGPFLVTPDEVPDAYALEMSARVNGEEWSRGSSRDMHWSFEEMIEYVSRDETLHPGDFFGSGTCSGARGSGCGLEQGRFLEPGDVVELEVERLGVLRNSVGVG